MKIKLAKKFISSNSPTYFIADDHDYFENDDAEEELVTFPADDFSREEGLRSFGLLLRTGKLQKLDGGRFKASEQIGFQPDERAVG